MGAKALGCAVWLEVVSFDRIIGEDDVSHPVKPVAALGVFLDVPGDEVRGVAGHLDELGIDQALLRFGLIARPVRDLEPAADRDGLGDDGVEPAEQVIASHEFFILGVSIGAGIGAQGLLDAFAHVLSDAAVREDAPQGEGLGGREAHGVQSPGVPVEGHDVILAVECDARPRLLVRQPLEEFDDLPGLLRRDAEIASECAYVDSVERVGGETLHQIEGNLEHVVGRELALGVAWGFIHVRTPPVRYGSGCGV